MTRRCRQFRHAAIVSAAVAALFIAGANPAPAQVVTDAAETDEPIIIGQRRQFDRLHLDRADIALELTNVYQRDRTTTANGATTTSQQLVFQQILQLDTQGYVLSPHLFTLDIGLGAGVSENWANTKDDVTDDSTSDYGGLYEWDVEGVFRPSGPAPLTLYSRREQGWIFREFGPAIQTTTTDTGAALDIRSRVAPTRFAVSHLDSEQTGLEEIDDFSYTRDAFDWNTTYLPTANQTVTWDYTYASVNQEGVTDQQFQTHDATLSHELVFGPRRRHNLTSRLNYYQQSGDFDLHRFRWDERLRLRHSDDFRTRYDYTYDQSDSGGAETRRHRASAGFTHELYDSLTTSGDVGVQRTEAGDAISDEIFADINWNYRKKVPLGNLSAALGLAWSKQRSDAQTEPVQVINQPAVFTDSQPIVIVGNNVNPNSLIITDPSGLLIYQEGVDYTVNALPDRVEIDRVVGGRIAAGQSVLLDYQLAPLPAANTTSRSFSTGVRYDFERGPLKGLTLYTTFAKSVQDIDTDSPGSFVANNYTDTIYGTEYRFWKVILGASHQDHDSSVNPFEADRGFIRYTERVRDHTLLAFNAAYTSIQYFEPENHTDLLTASAQLEHQFTPRLVGNITLLYRYEDDELAGLTKGFEQQFELRWRHRQTYVYAVVRTSQLDNPSQDQSFEFFQLGLRREF